MPCNNSSCLNHGCNIVIDTSSIFAILKCIKYSWNQKGLPFSEPQTIDYCLEKIALYLDAIVCCDVEGKIKLSDITLVKEIDPSNTNSSFNSNLELRQFYGQSTDLKNEIKSKLFSYLRPIEVINAEISELKSQISRRRIEYARNFSRSRADLSLVVAALKLNTDVIFLCEDINLNNTLNILRYIQDVIINGNSYQTSKIAAKSVSGFFRLSFKCCELTLTNYLSFVHTWGIQCLDLSQSSSAFPRHIDDIGSVLLSVNRDRDEKERAQSQI